eukprot:TRINITY_DN80185_c0_g1_i1.p1 TRINITY_DN80185_c0_g1~~TRINITY_DN80185_c0_g1_i1.p1  ORF type:complete len:647 (-),score=107.28 TRINITY_DN80185_c0_g1_i1:28-1968(-)
MLAWWHLAFTFPVLGESSTFKLVERAGKTHCSGSALWEGISRGRNDCRAKCERESRCSYFSLWLSRGESWCRLTASCSGREEHEDVGISIYEKQSNGTTARHAGSTDEAPQPALPLTPQTLVMTAENLTLSPLLTATSNVGVEWKKLTDYDCKEHKVVPISRNVSSALECQNWCVATPGCDSVVIWNLEGLLIKKCFLRSRIVEKSCSSTPTVDVWIPQGCFKNGFWPGLTTHWIVSAGQIRRFVVYIPRKAVLSAEKLPLWLLLHGSWSSPEEMIWRASLIELAEREGFVFVAPEATHMKHIAWHPREFDVGLHSEAMPRSPNDVYFVKELLAVMEDRHCIDLQRVYCVGYSNGGRMCMRLASELENRFAAMAVVSGLRFPKPNNATSPMPIVAIHGTEDRTNPWKGSGRFYWNEGVEEAFQRWVLFDNCTGNRSQTVISMGVTLFSYDHCSQGAEMKLVRVDGSGHTWPGSTVWWNETLLGPVFRQWSANDFIVDFLKRHALQDPPSRLHSWARFAAPKNAAPKRLRLTTRTSTVLLLPPSMTASTGMTPTSVEEVSSTTTSVLADQALGELIVKDDKSSTARSKSFGSVFTVAVAISVVSLAPALFLAWRCINNARDDTKESDGENLLMPTGRQVSRDRLQHQ